MPRHAHPAPLAAAVAIACLPLVLIACASTVEAPGADPSGPDAVEQAIAEGEGGSEGGSVADDSVADPAADGAGDAPATDAPPEASEDDEATDATATPDRFPTRRPIPTPTRGPTADVSATGTAVALERADTGIDVPLEDFVAELQARVERKDWTGMAALAADPIAVGPYRSEWSELPVGRLVSELGTFYLPAEAEPAFSPPQTDIAALLGGMDPTAMLGPDAEVVRVLHGRGWGARASDEVLLFVTEAPQGGYRWQALLWTSGAFSDS